MISFDAQTGVLQLCAVVLLSATGMAQAESCRAESFSGSSYAVCSFNLAKDRVRTFGAETTASHIVRLTPLLRTSKPKASRGGLR